MNYKLHPISDIEGIGVARAKELNKIDILYTEDLLLKSEDYLTFFLKKISGFPLTRLPEFISIAKFLQVNGLSGQHAEALYKAKIHTLLLLAMQKPSKIVNILDEAKSNGIIPESTNKEEVINWQKRALAIHYTSSVIGKVIHNNKPVQNAEIFCNFEEAITNNNGDFFIPVINYGKQKLIIRTQGYKTLSTKLDINLTKIHKFNFDLIKGQDKIKIIDEANGEPILNISTGDKVEFKDVDIINLIDKTPLKLKFRYKNGDIRLNGIHRKKIGHIIEVIRLRVSGDMVNIDDQIGQIYIYTNTLLEKTNHSTMDYRKKLLTDKNFSIDFNSSFNISNT